MGKQDRFYDLEHILQVAQLDQNEEHTLLHPGVIEPIHTIQKSVDQLHRLTFLGYQHFLLLVSKHVRNYVFEKLLLFFVKFYQRDIALLVSILGIIKVYTFLFPSSK